MKVMEIWIYLGVYLIPILFFVYMGVDVLLRNSKKLEHRLIALTSLVYILMFLEEFVRHLLPISYSPELSALWFSNIGIMMPGLGLHFLVAFSRKQLRIPKWLNPTVFYLPLLIIPFNIISRQDIISSSTFIQQGIWKFPVYNTPYYIALTISIVLSMAYFLPLYFGRKRVKQKEHRSIYHLLIFNVIICSLWHIVFGYFQFQALPPYTYIYGGVIWCFLLRLAMVRYDFLTFENKKYEKLFNLNPTAILLFELTGEIREANPSARKLFIHTELEGQSIYSLISDELKRFIEEQQEIADYEASIEINGKQVHLLIDGGYVSVDNVPHMIVIVRDVSAQKAYQERITFLAYHDSLTHLPNRVYFYEQLEYEIQEAAKNESRIAVILVDLDLFKQINDKLGHDAGDRLLQHTANIMQTIIAPYGMAARLGGDEFVLFIRNAETDSMVNQIVEQLRQSLAQEKFHYEGNLMAVSSSMGISMFPNHGRTRTELLKSADIALYLVKNSGRNHAHMATK